MKSVREHDFDLPDLFKHLQIGEPLGLAVSGGGDSMALMHLVKLWQLHQGKNHQNPSSENASSDHVNSVHVLTVDHGLRDAAKDEVKLVAEEAEKLGFKCHILAVSSLSADEDPKTGNIQAGNIQTGNIQTGNIQAWARRGRYRLLIDTCHRLNIKQLVTAHHQDDQVETFVMRLARGSGLRGLCAMRPVTDLEGLQLIRPFLSTPKRSLMDFVVQANVQHVNDLSNLDTKFKRVQVREVMSQFNTIGVSSSDIFESIERLQVADDAINTLVNQAYEQDIDILSIGAARIDAKSFFERSDEVKHRILFDLLEVIGGQEYGPRARQLNHIIVKLHEALILKKGLKLTLAKCIIDLDMYGEIWIYREIGRLSQENIKISGVYHVWDGRFLVKADPKLSNLRISPFYNLSQNLSQNLNQVQNYLRRECLKDENDAECSHPDMMDRKTARNMLCKETGFTNLPMGVLDALPSIWQGETCIAIAGIRQSQAIEFEFLGPRSNRNYNFNDICRL